MKPVRQLIYLHGFASSPQSTKAGRFRDEAVRLGVGFSCPDFNQPAFESLTVTRMLGQTRDAIRTAGDGPVALVGSSLGAFVAVMAVSRLSGPAVAAVDRLILLAPALDFGGNRLRQLGERGIDDWRASGSLTVFHYADGVNRNVGFQLYEDAARYDAHTVTLTMPVLLFQGRRDESVDPAMVISWAARRPGVDLRLLDDTHQLTESLDAILRDSLPFLGFDERAQAV